MKKVVIKSGIVLVLVLAGLTLSSLSTYLIYDFIVVDQCLDDGGQYISDLAMCFYEDDSSAKASLHAYTLLYIMGGATAFFVVLLAFAYTVLKNKYNNALKVRMQ